MPIIQFTDEDELRNKIVKPDFYEVEILSIGQKAPKTTNNPDTKIVWPVTAKIIRNATNGSDEFAGVQVYWNFNDNPRALGIIKGFLKCLGADTSSGSRVELNAAVGRRIEVFITNGEWEGRITNRAEARYRPVRQSPSQQQETK